MTHENRWYDTSTPKAHFSKKQAKKASSDTLNDTQVDTPIDTPLCQLLSSRIVITEALHQNVGKNSFAHFCTPFFTRLKLLLNPLPKLSVLSGTAHSLSTYLFTAKNPNL